jgi:sugar phosphate isomerase/epimerase
VDVYKNFSAPLLGISGRQSELIELALTYAFRGIDVDMGDMVKRSQRTDFDDASKYLRAADILVGGFNVGVNLDADDESFTAQLAALHPMSEVAEKLEAKRAFVLLPAATDRAPYPEYFEQTQNRLNQIGAVLGERGIRVGVVMNAAKDAAEGKQYEFVRNVEGYLALIKGVSAKNVGYVIDSWSWHVGGGTAETLAQIDPQRVVIVRLADLAADASADGAKASDRVIPTVDGRVDQVSIVKWLASNEFDGPVLPTSSAAKAKGQTRESIVNSAQEGIDAIFKAAGLTVDPRPMDLIQTLYADMGRDDEDDRPSRSPRVSSNQSDNENEDSEDSDDDTEEVGSNSRAGSRAKS